MNLNDYFNPVSLEQPTKNLLPIQGNICYDLTIHTPNSPINNILGFTHAIIGVCEDRGSTISGSSNAPDIVRSHFYKLSSIKKNLKILDLGNLKNTETINDTYYGLRDVLEFLILNNIIPILIGGSQDISYSIPLVYNQLKRGLTLTTVDFKPDFTLPEENPINSSNYLNSIFKLCEQLPYFNYYNLGNQACYTYPDAEDLIISKWHEMVRMGKLRNNIQETEPYIRETNFLSIDISAVKHADAPGQNFVSPNGFNADEICQIAHYAGFSNNLNILGLFEMNPNFDHNNTTSALMAQIIWFYLYGFTNKMNEDPIKDTENFKKYTVTNNNPYNNLVYYKSEKTHRWWCEIQSDKLNGVYLLPCSENEYIEAMNNELPGRWFNANKRLN